MDNCSKQEQAPAVVVHMSDTQTGPDPAGARHCVAEPHTGHVWHLTAARQHPEA